MQHNTHPTNPQSQSSDTLLRLPEVLTRVHVSRASWFRLIRAGKAPKPIKLGSASLWRESEISSWIASLEAA